MLPGTSPFDPGVSPSGVEWFILGGVGVVFVVINEVLTNGRVSVEIFLLTVMVFEVVDVVDSPALRMPFKLPLPPRIFLEVLLLLQVHMLFALLSAFLPEGSNFLVGEVEDGQVLPLPLVKKDELLDPVDFLKGFGVDLVLKGTLGQVVLYFKEILFIEGDVWLVAPSFCLAVNASEEFDRVDIDAVVMLLEPDAEQVPPRFAVYVFLWFTPLCRQSPHRVFSQNESFEVFLKELLDGGPNEKAPIVIPIDRY